MKPRWMFWWLANAVWLGLFALGSFIVWTLEVDGAGVKIKKWVSPLTR